MEFEVSKIKDFEPVVKALLIFAGSRRKILFSGEIGAGKTTMIQYLCKELGVEEMVTSPTYSLINEYEGKKEDIAFKIQHMDLYRLKDLDEALNIGIETYLYDESWCFIEWPELIAPILPDDTVKVEIKITGNSSRKILFL